MLDDPTTFREAMAQVDSAQLIEALKIEYENLRRKGVLKGVCMPHERKRFIDSKLVFKRKYKDVKMSKYKVRQKVLPK